MKTKPLVIVSRQWRNGKPEKVLVGSYPMKSQKKKPSVRGDIKKITNLEKIIKERIAYGKKYRLKMFNSGWSRIESGPCCNKCRINRKAIAESGHAVAFRLTVGCKDPFQVECKCHIPYRKVAEKSIQEELKNILFLVHH